MANSITGTVEVKVRPDVLITQAEEVRRLANDMKTKFAEMDATLRKTSGYWIGEAGDIHRKLYNDQKDDIDKMLRRLLEHPDDLLMISQNYSLAERSNVATSNSLPSDVIQ